MKNKKIFSGMILVVFLVSLVLKTNAWVEPTGTENIVAPLNTSSTAQTKAGDLGTNGSLCIKGDCKSSWPTGSSDTLQSVTARGNTSNGSVNINGNLIFNSVLSTPGRMHIDGQEDLYILNKGTTRVSKAWGGTGNLSVEGNFCLGSDCRTVWPVHTWFEYFNTYIYGGCSTGSYHMWGYYLRTQTPSGKIHTVAQLNDGYETVYYYDPTCVYYYGF